MPPTPLTPTRHQPQPPPTKAEREARVFRIQLNVGSESWFASKQRFAIGAVPLDKDGNPVHGLAVEWSTSDKQVVFVTRDGKATAGRVGNARLIVRAGHKQESVKINVYDSTQTISHKNEPPSRKRTARNSLLARAAKGKTVFAHPVMPSGTDDRLPDAETNTLYQPANKVGKPEGKTEAAAATPAAATEGTETPGSANFSFDVSLVGLPGRKLNTSLALSYNSRIWHKSFSGSTTKMYYDVDSGWPAPGFRLGYGQIEHQGTAGFTLTEPDGTRRQMTSIGYNMYRTTDGSLITYDGGQWGGTVTYPDGTHIWYWGTGGARCYPGGVTDRHGNHIYIYYVNSTGPKISMITDTLGRNFLFYYSGNDLIAITAPGYNGGSERQVARFYYETITLPICCDTYTLFAYGIQVTSASTARVLRYVYLPGTQTGYRYDYSSYGMIYKTYQLRGMTVDTTSLSAMGWVNSDGDVAATTEYNYPLTPQVLTDAPKYTTRTDDWAGRTTATAPLWTFTSDGTSGISTVTSPAPEYTVTETQSDPTTGQVQSITLKYQGNVLSKRAFTWESSTAGPRLQKVEITNDAPQTRAITYDYDPNTIFNNVTVLRERDFATPGTLGTELRRVETAYENSSNYTNRGLIHLPLTSKVFAGGSSSPASFVAYTYDQGTLLNRPNVIMHDASYNPSSPPQEYCDFIWNGHYDEWICNTYPVYNPATAYRGNVTTVTAYADAANASGATTNTMSYDIVGNVVEATANCCRRKTFAYSDTYYNAYITSQSQGETGQLSTNATFDFNTGILRTSVDENNRTTTIHYDPASLRSSEIVRPQGLTTFIFYDRLINDPDSTRRHSYVLTTTQRDANNSISSYQYLDGRGAVARSFSGYTSAQGWITQDIEYDDVGRAFRGSQPYYSSGASSAINPSGLWSMSVFDRLNRVTSVTGPSGDTGSTTTSASALYAGTVTTRTDAAQRQRRQITDALGRVIYLDEPDINGTLGEVSSPTQRTAYEYDSLDNLTRVTQGTQIRQFKYDSLSQLTHEKQLEADAKLNDLGTYISGGSLWTGVYAYNSFGLITDAYNAQGTRAQFSYDTLNRLKTITYSGESTQTPTVNYTYGDEANPIAADSKGRVIKVETSAIGSTPTTAQEFDYDLLGRATTQRQKIAGTTYTLGYSYNYLGQLTSATQPSGRVISYGFDAAARLISVGDSANRISASSFGYAAHGGLEAETWGNGGVQNLGYNRSLQLKSLALSRNGSEVEHFEYKYGVTDIESGTVDESKNTGRVARIEGFIGGPTLKQWQQRYSYDTVGRLSKAREVRGDNNQQVWQTAYTYDRWGNRYQSGSDNSGVNFEQVLGSDVSTASNRFISTVQKPISYDDAGQLASDGKFRGMQYQYDANGRMRWAARLDGTGVTSATFDGGGQRVQTILNGSTRNFVYNISGQVVAEYRSGVLDREYIYQGGAVLATDEQPRSCSLTTSTFVSNFFSSALNPQSIGTQSQWTTSLDQAMAQGFDPLLMQAQSLGNALFTSTDYVNQGRNNTQFVTDLYWAYLQRGPDQGGLDFWVYQLTNNGASRDAIRGEFARSLEFQYKVAGVCSALGGTAAVKYVFRDHQGSTRAVMDGNGNILARHDYLPFGEELWANTGMRTASQQFGVMDQNRTRYALTEKDEATGLDHTRWRKYENTSGRWTSPDPVNGNLGDPQSFNRYSYVQNDPINLIDPSGLQRVSCWWMPHGVEDQDLVCIYAPDSWEGFFGGRRGGYEDDANQGDPCAHLLPACVPPGADVDQNISTTEKEVAKLRAEAQGTARLIRSTGDMGANAAAGSAAMVADVPGGGIDQWFDSMVADRNPWDYKYQDAEGARRGDSGYEEFGNFNYGATGAAAGYSLNVLQHMAGFVQQFKPEGIKSPNKVMARLGRGGEYPYGDQLKDAKAIERGVEYYNCRKAHPR